jgi:hypothetical protein
MQRRPTDAVRKLDRGRTTAVGIPRVLVSRRLAAVLMTLASLLAAQGMARVNDILASLR